MFTNLVSIQTLSSSLRTRTEPPRCLNRRPEAMSGIGLEHEAFTFLNSTRNWMLSFVFVLGSCFTNYPFRTFDF